MQVNTLSKNAPFYGENELIFRSIQYKDGEIVETPYYRGDSIELSGISMSKLDAPLPSENYGSIVKQLAQMKKMPQMKEISLVPGNKLFYETMEIMNDFYDGKIGKEDVKEIYKKYCACFFGAPDGGNSSLSRKSIAQGLADMYEYFSRANTRAANNQNAQERKEICRKNGLDERAVYYNSKYYYACEEMQDLFKSISDELAEEYGCEKVDFKYVEEHTKFGFDGGITYNGVWDHRDRNINRLGSNRALDFNGANKVPPKNFVYFSALFPEKLDAGKLKGSLDALTGRKNQRKAGSLLLYHANAGNKSLLTNDIARDKKSPLSQGADFIRAFSYRYSTQRLEYCGMWE